MEERRLKLRYVEWKFLRYIDYIPTSEELQLDIEVLQDEALD